LAKGWTRALAKRTGSGKNKVVPPKAAHFFLEQSFVKNRFAIFVIIHWIAASQFVRGYRRMTNCSSQ
jgi:hypothetical protein